MQDFYKEFITKYPQYDKKPMIQKAFQIAEQAHEGQLRKSGEPYVTHPVQVAYILAELGLDETSIIAGILHDVIEDTDYTTEQIRELFGPEVTKLVDGVTKLSKFDFQTKEEQQAESLRKMFLAMASDIRVVIIKLADRLHNMRTLKYQPPEKQKEKARETLEIYAPLAHRLGINAIKWELEDLSLKYLDHDAYMDIAAKISSTRKEREEETQKVIDTLRKKFDSMNLDVVIEGRAKHIYSIYRKMKTKFKSFEEVFDLIAVRIIVNTVRDCYAALGVVHTMWKPLPMRFKDYIAVPKENVYQSLHTTVLGEDGRPFEVQIRTHEMHKIAEYGIAAHWKYKEGIKNDEVYPKLDWLKELTEWQTDLKDSKEFVESLKIDFFSDNVFVFTPKGDVKTFVKGSTPLDFAYSIHSDIGNHCVGAKINGKIVPLDYELKTGDVVAILTSAAHKGPSRDWLKIVKTTQARNKIRQWFKKELKEENIIKGKDMLEKEAKRLGYNLFELMKNKKVKDIFSKFTIQSIDDLYAAVGYGGITTNQVLFKLIEQYKADHHIVDAKEEVHKTAAEKEGNKANHDAVIVKGQGDMVVRFAKCCNPVPGDKIIGYITRGRGVSVHRADCRNINDIDFESDRRIEVAWSNDENSTYMVELEIKSIDRPKLLMEISQVLYSSGYNIIALNVRTGKNLGAVITVRIEISDVKEINQLISKLQNISGVSEVFRVNY